MQKKWVIRDAFVNLKGKVDMKKRKELEYLFHIYCFKSSLEAQFVSFFYDGEKTTFYISNS